MGGSLLAGLIAGMGKRQHEEDLRDRTQAYQQAINLAEHYHKLSEDEENYTPEQRTQLRQIALQIPSAAVKNPAQALKKFQGAFGEIMAAERPSEMPPAEMPPQRLAPPKGMPIAPPQPKTEAQQINAGIQSQRAATLGPPSPPDFMGPPAPAAPEISGMAPGGPGQFGAPALAGLQAPSPPPIKPLPVSGPRSDAERLSRRVGEAKAVAGATAEAQREAQKTLYDIEVTPEEAKILGIQPGRMDLRKFQVLGGIRRQQMMPHSVTGQVPGSALKMELPEDSLGNPIDETTAYTIQRDGTGNIVGAYPVVAGVIRGDIVPDPSMPNTGYARILRDKFGNEVNREEAPAPPSTLPTTTQSTQVVTLTGTNGEQQVVQVPVTRTTTRGRPAPPSPPGAAAPAKEVAPKATGAPSAPAPPGLPAGSKVLGEKPIPPALRARTEAHNVSVDANIKLVRRLQSNLDVLNNIIDAGKIALVVSPEGMRAAIGRGVNLTPQEAQVAADFQSMSEHINVLREALQAQGFRGPEAFEALQAQRGRLMANPEITKRVLENTMGVLQGLRRANYSTLRKPLPTIDVDTAKTYLKLAGGNKEKARSIAEQDGWSFGK